MRIKIILSAPGPKTITIWRKESREQPEGRVGQGDLDFSTRRSLCLLIHKTCLSLCFGHIYLFKGNRNHSQGSNRQRK